MKPSSILLVSIKPEYAEKIRNGEKTIELRKSAPTKWDKNTIILIYVTAPVKELWAVGRVKKIIKDSPSALWKKVKDKAGITEEDYNEYFANQVNGYGLVLSNMNNIPPIELADLKDAIDGFNPPQTYKYLSFEEYKLIIPK
jgi:predicted transcriptional regulator